MRQFTKDHARIRAWAEERGATPAHVRGAPAVLRLVFGPLPRNWEPEPLRFIGARGVYRLYREADRREATTGRQSRIAVVANALAGR